MNRKRHCKSNPLVSGSGQNGRAHRFAVIRGATFFKLFFPQATFPSRFVPGQRETLFRPVIVLLTYLLLLFYLTVLKPSVKRNE